MVYFHSAQPRASPSESPRMELVPQSAPPPSVIPLVPPNSREKYGAYWPEGMNDITIELACFRQGRTFEEGGLGKAGHFKEIVNTIWGPHNDRQHFRWSPWGDRKLDAACAHKYLAVSGCANSEKSDFFAVWAIVNFIAAPTETMVLITSTSLKESRGRIWGRVEDYWLAAQHVCGDALPGKLVSSVGMIRFNDPTGEYKTSDRCGIHLIAGEKKKEKESIGKMIGLKNQRVLFIADELPELSHAILEAAFSNLAANPEFQLIGIGNPASIYDPHGVLSKPKHGWASVSVADDEWETERGYQIRFDATKSPNVLAGKTLYPWLPTQAKIDAAMSDTGGEDSAAFWRMWRGFWCPHGATESVVSEADIIKFACDTHRVRWKTPPVEFSFFDPGFTTGGDRSIAMFGKFGVDHEDKSVLLYTGYKHVTEDVTKKAEPRNFQIAAKWRDLCLSRGIAAERAAYDNTGAAAFGDIVSSVWSQQVTPINFGGKPSILPVSVFDKTPASDKYINRMTEIWCSIKEYMRSSQIRGIDPDLGQELTSRRMKNKKDMGLKAQVEPKEIYRSRVGKSPDIADAALGLLDFLRSKYRFRAAARNEQSTRNTSNWRQWVKKRDALNRSNVWLDRAA